MGWKGRKMSDDLVKRAAALVEKQKAWDKWEYPSQPAPPATVEGEVATLVSDMADEIARLRAAINDALAAPFSDPELNGTWHQETIGPNETPEEAVKRLVSVRAEWAVYKNNCENPVIAELRAALATARREGMEECAKWHDAANEALGKCNGWQAPIREGEKPKDVLDRLVHFLISTTHDQETSEHIADMIHAARREGMERAVAILRARHRGLEHIREWREAQHCADEIEAEIRAAAGEGKS